MFKKFIYQVLASCGVLVLTLAGCSEESGQVDLLVESELQAYIDRFEEEAALRGQTVDWSTQQLEAQIQEIINPTVAGQCTRHDDSPNVIIIDSSTWRDASDLEKEYLVFHELGHCYLNRGHRDEINPNGTCVSMMQSGTISCRRNYNQVTRAAYIDELFE
ncbi:MAG: putative metallopeptidase [Bacteroidota bacterium]